jgi:hypothetical protein
MLKITTPNAQGASGQSKLNTYTFSGQNGRKFFSVENDNSPSTSISFTLVNETPINGLTGGFRMFPGSTSGNYSMNITMPPLNNMSFSIDYDKSWGDSLQAKLYSSINIFTYDGSGASTSHLLIGPTSSITFDYESNQTQTRRDLGSLLCQDSDGNYQISQNSVKITEDETSFGLVRTNPKLTGNVKLTVDSNQDIWLNSIDAEKELSDDRYKKYRIGKNASYASDLNRFFDLGNTPPELVFSLYQQDTQYTSSKRNFSEQYDKFYQYGVTELKSKFYDEDFSFFAPLYLKNEIPDNFVIFRTNGPVNAFSYETSFDEWKNYVTPEILANSQIIKTYSLAEDTSIGMYLRSIVNHPSRTETDLTVSYQTNGYTYYNGISYQKGSFSQMGELLYDYYNEENPLMSVEEFITLGFERHKVISSHVINLEFLFDDVNATNYTINRYFGMYVNTVDLAKFTISEQGLQLFSKDLNQTPFPRKGVDGNKISQKSFTQNNPDGISVFIDTATIERTSTIDSKSFTAPILSVNTDFSQTLSVELKGNYLPRLNIGDLFTMTDNIVYETTNTVIGLNYDNNITLIDLSFPGVNALTGITGMNLNCNFYEDLKYSNFIDEIFNNDFIQSQPRFFYLKDNVGNLHSIDSTQNKYFGGTDSFKDEKVIQVKLKDVTLDISKLGGFSNLLTQTEATILDAKGKASISVEILDYFSPNDYIEITWNSPSANLGYPLRWRVIANDSMLNPGQHWPTFAIDTDAEGEYYVSYFHTGDSTIKLKQLVESISDAFNVFPFKDFDILAKDTFLHFRSTQDGRSSETAQIRISTDIPNMKISGTPAFTNGVVNFIGGSERRRTRCKVRTSIAQGMLIDEYISTIGSFSLPRVYNVLGSRLVFSSYLEEPVYDDLGNLVDFNGVDDFKIVCIEDESSTIQHTSDNKITTYELFKPSYGILSVMPLRDFDTDFFYSDYTKSYTPELIRYFERAYPPVKVISISGNTYTFDKEIDPNFSSTGATAIYLPYLIITDSASTPELHNEKNQFLYTGGNTATMLLAPGAFPIGATNDVILFLPGEKHMFFSDSELSKFKGFLSLSGVVSSQDEDTFKSLENQWDPTRFVFQNINSEYERLEENYLKSLVLKSRVVPYISKWVSPQGKDIRDNSYRLNYHRSFGNTNFSPSAEISIPDPRYHTHEWPYLDSVPDEFPTAKYPDQMFSYMFDQLSDTYDFSSIKKDWFSDYFTVGYPCEKYLDSNGNFVSANIEPSEKYAYFNYQNYDDTTQALFRGYKIGIRELDSAGIPINESTKYNNYKFSVIIETREDDSYLEEEPITYKTIINEKWKFILIKITLRISSYRYTTGNVSYVDLYTMYNNDEVATFTYDPALPSTIPGYQRAIPEDKKLSVGLNFTSASTNAPLTTGIYFFDSFSFTGSSYIVDLREELKPLSDGVFSRIVGTNTIGNIETSISLKNPIQSVYSNNTIQLDDNMYDVIKSSIPFSTMLTLGSGGSFPWNKTVLYHQSGGNASGAGIRERLTFSEIVKVINGTSAKSIMLYEIYDVNGNVSYPTKSNLLFSMYTISPEALTRIYDYFPVSDTDKPQEFYTHTEIGAVLSQQKDLQTIYRYQGNFSPKFRDVLKFWVREDDTFTNVASRDFLLNNTRIGDNFLNFSTLRNQYYSKVSDQEILKISTESGYKPVYPLINEIVIDKKDEFAWSSSWDNLYYRKYTTTESFNDVKGTQEMKEVKSMLGSKAMKVPKQYDLYEYETAKSATLDLSSYINDEFVYYEDSKFAYLQINVYNRLLREMIGTDIDHRAKTEFLKALNLLPSIMDPIFDPLLIDDYVKQYLEKNILDLFQISDIKLYVLQTGNPAANSIATITPKSEHRPLIENTTGTSLTLSEGVLLNKGYIKQKDVNITNIGNMIFKIKYPLDSRFYTSLSVGVAVKRI